MKHIILMEAFEMRKVAKMGIHLAQEQMMLCSQELDQPLQCDEADQIIAQMMELQFHQDACEQSLKVINNFIKTNKYLFN